MSLVWAVYVTVPLVTLVVDLGLAYWIHTRHSDVRGSRWFVISLVFTVAWMLFEVVSLTVTDRSVQWAATDLGTRLSLLSFLAFFVFASLYSQVDFHRHWLAKVGFGVVLALVALPSLLEPVDDLVFEQWLFMSEPFPYAAAEPGTLYLLGTVVVVLLQVVSLIALVQYLLSTPRYTETQLVLVIIGSLSITLFFFLGYTGIFPASRMDHASYGALLFAVFTSTALFRFQLFDVKPVARNAVVEGLQDPVFVLDWNRRLVDYNRAAAELVPGIEDDFGEPFEAVHPTLSEAATFPTDAPETSAQTKIALDGSPRYFSVNVSRVGDDGGETADWYSILLRDVTDLEQSRWQLEKQNERLEQVAATISHDLRNPINVADGYAEMLEVALEADDLDPEDVEALHGRVAKIRGAHDRMGEIIDDLLTLAREGQSVSQTESLTLASVAHDAWENVTTGEATLTIAADRPLAADRSKLLTLFENLYRNAVEHGGTDVEVTVDALEDGFSVADDGPGIPAADAEAVFEYGYTTNDQGTGLGLSIVRTIAESHGWSVELDEVADGTRFCFRNVNSGRADHDDERSATDADVSTLLTD